MAERGAPLGSTNRRNGREWSEALRRAMAHRAEGDYRGTLLKIADAVVAKALEGDPIAWREISEREEGKTAQAVELGNRDGESFKTSVEVKFVDKDP
jgi:hypothetical protein